MIGEDHWLADPRFDDDQARADHGEIVSARMSEWCGGRTCAEALAELEKANIVAGQVYSPQQALDDPHIRAAHLLEEREFPGLDATVPLAPTPIDLSETPGTYRRPRAAPRRAHRRDPGKPRLHHGRDRRAAGGAGGLT